MIDKAGVFVCVEGRRIGGRRAAFIYKLARTVTERRGKSSRLRDTRAPGGRNGLYLRLASMRLNVGRRTHSAQYPESFRSSSGSASGFHSTLMPAAFAQRSYTSLRNW